MQPARCNPYGSIGASLLKVLRRMQADANCRQHWGAIELQTLVFIVQQHMISEPQCLMVWAAAEKLASLKKVLSEVMAAWISFRNTQAAKMDPTCNTEEKSEERLLVRCLFVLAKISCREQHIGEEDHNSFETTFYNFLQKQVQKHESLMHSFDIPVAKLNEKYEMTVETPKLSITQDAQIMAFVGTGQFIDPNTNRKTYEIAKVESILRQNGFRHPAIQLLPRREQAQPNEGQAAGPAEQYSDNLQLSSYVERLTFSEPTYQRTNSEAWDACLVFKTQ